jgi:hypothetical protein
VVDVDDVEEDGELDVVTDVLVELLLVLVDDEDDVLLDVDDEEDEDVELDVVADVLVELLVVLDDVLLDVDDEDDEDVELDVDTDVLVELLLVLDDDVLDEGAVVVVELLVLLLVLDDVDDEVVVLDVVGGGGSRIAWTRVKYAANAPSTVALLTASHASFTLVPHAPESWPTTCPAALSTGEPLLPPSVPPKTSLL